MPSTTETQGDSDPDSNTSDEQGEEVGEKSKEVSLMADIFNCKSLLDRMCVRRGAWESPT